MNKKLIIFLTLILSFSSCGKKKKDSDGKTIVAKCDIQEVGLDSYVCTEYYDPYTVDDAEADCDRLHDDHTLSIKSFKDYTKNDSSPSECLRLSHVGTCPRETSTKVYYVEGYTENEAAADCGSKFVKAE